MERGVIVLGVVLFLMVVIVTCTVLYASSKKNKNSAVKRIDIVLVDRGRGRTGLQLAAVTRYMGNWANSILIVHAGEGEGEGEGEIPGETPSMGPPIFHVDSNNKNVHEIVQNIRSLHPEIAEHVLFLGDTTLPLQNVDRSDLWSRTKKKRIFNYLLGTPFDKFIEHTVPVTLIAVTGLERTGSLDAYLLSLTLSDEIVFSPTINKQIILMDNKYTDDVQINSKDKELFVSAFISPDLPEEAQKRMNETILEFLTKPPWL